MRLATKQKQILIVDDTPEVMQILALTLRKAGHDVGTAVNGLDGLEKFREKYWDLVITDMQMPLMNGEEMTVAIKAEVPTIPVIMITGSVGIVHRTGVFFAFIAKPFSAPEILALVDGAPPREGHF